ncbi:hypothetical protein O9G_005629 [Rozella allomycis CSF55]|uniref:Uncharacterized protein n=1 Tax=Rozella allomycis (strain CSF55) TaxID=988480 RepID=A0A075ATH3_ROZAC|nr:hypothetical protein O9G_005629 [Rozella allomycis CSF55]|eukprot:EPZ33548.1 hypothetical protein O9G_005629 [Rozella allomycis CSF55]
MQSIADIDSFNEDKLGYADPIEELHEHGSRIVKLTGLKNQNTGYTTESATETIAKIDNIVQAR